MKTLASVDKPANLQKLERGVCFGSHSVETGVFGVAAFSPFMDICTVCGIQEEFPQWPQYWDLYIVVFFSTQ